MIKTQTAIGWMSRKSKTVIRRNLNGLDAGYTDVYLHAKKGTRNNWEPGDWPPIKVTVTATWEVDDD